MELFTNRYPYTDFHELNLDWLIELVQKLNVDMKTFVNINTIKYADPILWNISTQYGANTIVQDADGSTYLSKKPVPVGVSINNTEFWLKVANFDITAEIIKRAITSSDDGSSTTSTADRLAGDLVFLNNYLYKVLRVINIGDAYVEGDINPNVEKVTIEELLNLIKSDIQTEITNRQKEDSALDSKIDTINTTLDSKIDTVDTKADNINNDLNDKINIINVSLSDNEIINVKSYGAIGDGISDDTESFKRTFLEASTSGKSVYIPSGSYLISDTISITYNKPFSIFGVGNSSQILHGSNTNVFEFLNRVDLLSVSDIRITSINNAKENCSAFYFRLGCYRIKFENIRYDLDNEDDTQNRHYPWSLFDCPNEVETDTVAFINCYLEHINGPAIHVGTGSSVWITGGRIVGTGFTEGKTTSIGLYCTGFMGGVYIVSVDFITLHFGIHITNKINKPNREFFISNTTFDGDDIGLVVEDGYIGTYIEITGCWICTSNSIGLYVPAGFSPCIKMSNCTVSLIGTKSSDPTSSYGINVNGGQVTVEDTRFYEDKGTAMYIALPTEHGIVSNCIFENNHNNGSVTGKVAVNNNTFINGTFTRGDEESIFNNNIGLAKIETPTVPASGISHVNNTGRRVMISINGTATIYINGTQVSSDTTIVILEPKDYISLAYSGSVTWLWFEV